MTTALFAVPGILAPLQGLFRWFAASTLASRSGLHRATLQGREKAGPITSRANAIKSIPYYASQTRSRGINASQNGCTGAFRAQTAASPVHAPPVRPVLRIMRVLEAGQAPASVGRMVISGRMADVCAELDRLAAREAALH